MTLGDLFSARLSISKQEQIIQLRGKNKNFVELEKKLSEIFYPKDKPFNYETKQNDILEAEANDLVELIKKNADAIIGGEISNTENKDSIDFSTLDYKVKQAEKILRKVQESISKETINSTEVMNKLNELTKILESGKKLLQDFDSYYGKKISETEVGSGNFTNIFKILNQMEAISNLTPLKNYSQRRGLILEEILGGGSSGSRGKKYDDFVNEMAQILSDKGITGIRIGQSIQRRGGSGSFYLADMKIDKTKNNKNFISEIDNKISLGELGSITSTIKYNTGSARQIKADVEIIFKPQIGHIQKFKASLKNWSSLKNKNLGTTSILSAVDRVGGNRQLTNAYGLSLGSTNESLLLQAHKMARLSILMDVITGYSQNIGYADTLIINTGKAIKVIDPRELINEIYGKYYTDGKDSIKSKDYIKGYNEEKLGQTGQNILNSIKQHSPGRTKIYLGNIFTYLAATKVTVMMDRQLLNK